MKITALTLLFSTFATSTLACDAPNLNGKFLQTIPTKPDQKLFSEAIVRTTNYERCKIGKAQLGTHASLRKAALIHSRNMAKTKKFSHTSRAGNARTLKDRAKLANLKWRWI